MSSSSGNTEESLPAFADTTLRILAANDSFLPLDVSFLPAPAQTPQPEQQGMASNKASVSETLNFDHVEARRETPGDQGTSNPTDESSEQMARCRARHYFETDASEVEDLYDSTGVDGLPDRPPTSSIVDLNLFSAEDEETGLPKPEANISPQNEGPKLPELMSAKGRALLRKHFFRLAWSNFLVGILLWLSASPKYTKSSRPYRMKLLGLHSIACAP